MQVCRGQLLGKTFHARRIGLSLPKRCCISSFKMPAARLTHLIGSGRPCRLLMRQDLAVKKGWNVERMSQGKRGNRRHDPQLWLCWQSSLFELKMHRPCSELVNNLLKGRSDPVKRQARILGAVCCSDSLLFVGHFGPPVRL
jgi:hypothetical protein